MEKKLKFNFVDVIIILVLIAVFAFGYKFINKSFDKGTETPEVTYTVEVKGTPEGYHELFEVGDKIRDAVKGGDLGVVTEVKHTQATDLGTDKENGKWVISEYEGQEDVYITIKGTPTSFGDNILMGQQDIKVGSLIHIKNTKAVGRGYVVTLDIEGEQK